MLCKLATALSKWKAAPFLGLSQTGPRLPLNAFVLSIISASMPTLTFIGLQTVQHLTFDTFSWWGLLRYSCSRMQGWVMVNCQNRRNCDVPGAAGFEPGSMRQRLKHRLRTQSRTSPHLLLQLTNPDMSHFTCTTDSLHPWDVFTNPSLIFYSWKSHILFFSRLHPVTNSHVASLTCFLLLWVFFLEDLSSLDPTSFSDCQNFSWSDLCFRLPRARRGFSGSSRARAHQLRWAFLKIQKIFRAILDDLLLKASQSRNRQLELF